MGTVEAQAAADSEVERVSGGQIVATLLVQAWAIFIGGQDLR